MPICAKILPCAPATVAARRDAGYGASYGGPAGHVEIALALLDSGAAVSVLEVTRLYNAQSIAVSINCRKNGVSQLLLERGAR